MRRRVTISATSTPAHQPGHDTMEIDDLNLFLQALDAGSLAGAARTLGTTRAAASRRLQRLEEEVGGALLHRSPRGLRATARGDEVAVMARRIVALQRNILATQDQQDAPQGELIISIPVLLGHAHLGRFAARFARDYPEIRLNVRLENRLINLLQEGVDVALRVGELPDSELISRKLGTARVGCYASAKYVGIHGLPDSPAALSEHALLLSDRDRLVAREHDSGEEIHVEARAALCVNDRSVLRDAALAGMGIAILPRFVGERCEPLVRVLSSWTFGDYPVSLVYLKESRGRAAVRAFADAYAAFLADDPL